MWFFKKKNVVDELILKAASGDIEAQFALAERYYHGYGTEQDVFRAIHWYAYAAANGCEKACEVFDRLYFHGINSQNKLMGFWFERECMFHQTIPPSVPFELRPIPYSDGEDKDLAWKATLPWSVELRTHLGEELERFRDITKRSLIEVSVADGYLLDPSRRGGFASGEVLSGNVSRDIGLPSFAVDIAARLRLLPDVSNISFKLLKHHEFFVDNLIGNLSKEGTLQESVESALWFSFMKGMEQQVACAVYENTLRHSCYNLYVAAEECIASDEQSIATDLPFHLTAAINKQSGRALDYSRAITKTAPNVANPETLRILLLTTAIVGDNWAACCGISKMHIGNYSNADMVTMDEARKIAGETLIKQVLVPSGAKIMNVNLNRDYQANILAEMNGERRAYIVRSSVYPENAAFLRFELDRLYEGSRANGFVPCFASVIVASCDERHFKDGVLLVGDRAKAMVSACDKLELEDD